MTKEVFILRVQPNEVGIDPFYLLWALSLKEVREQWRRVTLMQTNREDVGKRFQEICIPYPISTEWAVQVSQSFRTYFKSLAESKERFSQDIERDSFNYIASVSAFANGTETI